MVTPKTPTSAPSADHGPRSAAEPGSKEAGERERENGDEEDKKAWAEEDEGREEQKGAELKHARPRAERVETKDHGLIPMATAARPKTGREGLERAETKDGRDGQDEQDELSPMGMETAVSEKGAAETWEGAQGVVFTSGPMAGAVAAKRERPESRPESRPELSTGNTNDDGIQRDHESRRFSTLDHAAGGRVTLAPIPKAS